MPNSNEALKTYVDEQLQLVKQSIADNAAVTATSIAANTQLTAETKKEVGDLRAETQPIVDAMKTMAAGIRTIGRIGTISAKLAKLFILLAACWGAFKLLTLGASWSEVSASFMRSIGR